MPKIVDEKTLVHIRDLRNNVALLQVDLGVKQAEMNAAVTRALITAGGNPGDEIDEETGEIRPRQQR